LAGQLVGGASAPLDYWIRRTCRAGSSPRLAKPPIPHLKPELTGCVRGS
jgi:hypothetical protein